MESMLNLKPHSTDKADVFWPGDADPDRLTDDDLLEHIKSHAQTLYHPIGTAKIGHNEEDSVVASDLKVHGIQGLRIVDASIFPSQISGHPVRLSTHWLPYGRTQFFFWLFRRHPSLQLPKRLL